MPAADQVLTIRSDGGAELVEQPVLVRFAEDGVHHRVVDDRHAWLKEEVGVARSAHRDRDVRYASGLQSRGRPFRRNVEQVLVSRSGNSTLPTIETPYPTPAFTIDGRVRVDPADEKPKLALQRT